MGILDGVANGFSRGEFFGGHRRFRARWPFTLSLPRTTPKFNVLRKALEDRHVDTLSVLPKRGATARGYACHPAREPLKESCLGEVGDRPRDAVREDRLRPTRQQYFALLGRNAHNLGKTVTQLCRTVGLPVIVQGEARPHQRLEVRYRHCGSSRQEAAHERIPELRV